MDLCCMTTEPTDSNLGLPAEDSTEEPKRKYPSFAEREAAAKARVPREPVQYDEVPERQADMHERLLNWAKWCHSRGSVEVAPGFGLHKSDKWDERVYGRLTVVPVEGSDAVRIAIGVATLPEKHRHSLHWAYIRPYRSPRQIASALGVSFTGLAELIRDARQFLINRGV